MYILMTILSALLYSIPFFWPPSVIMMPLFIIPLFYVVRQKLSAFRYGMLWGSVAFGLHFIWVCILLLTKSSVTPLQAYILYGVIVLYASLSSGLWFYMLSRIRHPLGMIVATVGYLACFDRLLFLPLGATYPFVNPLVLLLRYKHICTMLSLLMGHAGTVPPVYHLPGNEHITLGEMRFVYVPACKEKTVRRCIQEVYNKLQALDLKANCVALGPETTYPYLFDKREVELCNLWGSQVPKDAYFLFGAGRSKTRRKASQRKASRRKAYQTVYMLSENLIRNRYDKTHKVPFTEKIPRWLKKYKWRMFKDTMLVCKGKEERLFRVGSLVMQPILCSELFMQPYRKLLRTPAPDILVAFVNDNWFCGYFRELLKLHARLKSICLGLPLIYVGHI